ncbi:MAG: DUF3450 family protein [Sulfuricurvum sp.]|nr:DUF3450 family protein [Sulfuricurvum sp.]
MFENKKKSLHSLALSCLMLSSPLLATQNNEEMVQSIMKLRSEVESLYSKIDENKESYKSQMKSLASQSADNKAQLNRQMTSKKLAQLELSKVQSDIAMASGKNVKLTPLLESGMSLLKESIRSGIPFKAKERMAGVDKIKQQLDAGVITEEKALSLLWAGFDDNLRMTKEIGVFKQEIVLDKKKVLCEVGKIGTVMMFFATSDNRAGYVVKEGNVYDYKVVNDEKEKEKIVALFSALKLQIRTGYFQLPNALVMMEGGK